jgi:hypothetical protein
MSMRVSPFSAVDRSGWGSAAICCHPRREEQGQGGSNRQHPLPTTCVVIAVPVATDSDEMCDSDEDMPQSTLPVEAAPLFKDPLLGSVMGDYRLLSPLGEGGMGNVYLGLHEAIGRRAAIKVLHESLSEDEEIVSRFFAEARAVNEIQHPNIVEATDFGKFQNRYYIVMELLVGETLQ